MLVLRAFEFVLTQVALRAFPKPRWFSHVRVAVERGEILTHRGKLLNRHLRLSLDGDDRFLQRRADNSNSRVSADG